MINSKDLYAAIMGIHLPWHATHVGYS